MFIWILKWFTKLSGNTKRYTVDGEIWTHERVRLTFHFECMTCKEKYVKEEINFCELLKTFYWSNFVKGMYDNVLKRFKRPGKNLNTIKY